MSSPSLPAADASAPERIYPSMTKPDQALFEELMSDGLAASRTNDSAMAIDRFRHASDAMPGEGLPQFLLGAEFAALGDMANAETAFANATRLAPDFAMARYQLGFLQFSAGRAAVALLTWQSLLQLPPESPLPHFIHGFEALAQDRFEEALRHYRQGLALNTDNEALSSDIEKIIRGIVALSSTPPADTPDAQQDRESEAHVLLANYQQRGPAH